MTATATAADVLELVRRAKYYYFGVLTSSAHMAWARVVCGRLKSDYRYSKDVVYNNFAWSGARGAVRERICMTAEEILKVRADFAGKTLAWLYDEKTMPEELRAAHRANDLAVMAAYGFSEDMTESEIVAALMEKYLQLTK